MQTFNRVVLCEKNENIYCAEIEHPETCRLMVPSRLDTAKLPCGRVDHVEYVRGLHEMCWPLCENQDGGRVVPHLSEDLMVIRDPTGELAYTPQKAMIHGV